MKDKKSNIHVLNMSAYTSPKVTEVKYKNWVEYSDSSGAREYKNNYFQYLIDRMVNSVTNRAVINGICDHIYGRGIAVLRPERHAEQYVKFKEIFSDKDIKRVICDRKPLGMAAFQVRYKGNQVGKCEHFPIQTLRPEIANDDGEIENWYYHPDWPNKKPGDKIEKIPSFGTKGKGVEIYVIKPYVPGYTYFPPVDYSGCLGDAVAEEEISDYHVNDIKNGFAPTTILNMNNGIPDEETQRKVSRDIISKTTGSTGKKTVVNFSDNQETSITVEKIPLDNAPEHYKQRSEECERNILKGHRAPSELLGFQGDNAGFANNAEELINKMRAFGNYVIKPFQMEILEAIEEILSVNQISLPLYFKTINPLEFIDTDNMDDDTQEEETGQTTLSMDDLRAFIAKGEDLGDEWQLMDERDVDYELESDFDLQVQEWSQELKTELSKKTWWQKLVSTGRANPRRKSEQDKEVEDNFYRVRYKYVGNPLPQRPFCIAMMAANKVYRKEDIIALDDKAVNPGWGPEGANTYSVWKYKGGGNCKHKWRRVTYKSKSIFQSIDSAEEISTNQAEREGYRVRNPKEVAMIPGDMPNNGFLNPR